MADISRVAAEWRPDIRFLVRALSGEDFESLGRLEVAGLRNLALLTDDPVLYAAARLPSVIEREGRLEDGDVVVVTPGRAGAHVLYRESDLHHSILLTNRCNSRCVMCSQPPTRQDDSWLVDEGLAIARHMRVSPRSVGLTGGEPLLLEARLRELLNAFSEYHPGTHLEVLTNGRLLSDPNVVRLVLAGLRRPVSWLVPLYGHVDFLHDAVVQAPGAFEQTIEGLLSLHAHAQPIQLRIVLIKPVLEELSGLCEFIRLNLPFVSEVALMGCEPIGFALAHREVCEVDMREWQGSLLAGVQKLVLAGIRPVLMNLPLCSILPELWPYSHQSISDWKRTFVDECADCTVKDRCAGLFAWHEKGWRPTTIRAMGKDGT